MEFDNRLKVFEDEEGRDDYAKTLTTQRPSSLGYCPLIKEECRTDCVLYVRSFIHNGEAHGYGHWACIVENRCGYAKNHLPVE